MGFDPQDEEIVRLLAKMKNAEGGYPSHLLAARRQQYLQQIAQIGFGIASNNGAKSPVEAGPTPSPAPAASTLLETILIVAIIAEASAVTYFYRDKLAGLLQRVTSAPRVVQVTEPFVITSPIVFESLTPSPAMTSTPLSPTVSASPIATLVVTNSTPVPGVAGDDPTTDLQVNSTPELNSSNGDNGNHYGQTPKPERTKENNGNNDTSDNNSSPRDNNNPPPNENQNEPKPTKSQ